MRRPAKIAAASLLLALACAVATPFLVHGQEASPLTAPRYDNAFWHHWGDGQAELAGYDLTFSRYGEDRHGTAVAIFVTERFDNATRVKADGNGAGTFPVMKLNLVRDFPTGVYDYNVMTSSFVALERVNGYPAGATTKVSFSSQEWCGHVYEQLVFDQDAVRKDLHSYFGGEADQNARLDAHANGIAEDSLLLWARGMAAPALAPGESQTLPILTSTLTARLRHRPLGWREVTLTRAQGTTQTEVPAGGFAVETLTAEIAGGTTWTFHVEQAAPHRLVRWTSTAGERAELLGADRMKYWQLHDNGGEAALARFGLSPRARRTP
ncbi:hypothetical protein OAX78_02185 [Planctomycetota bacterium]|nr:hypothetical protein [Planctomycetota bacterium]